MASLYLKQNKKRLKDVSILNKRYYVVERVCFKSYNEHVRILMMCVKYNKRMFPSPATPPTPPDSSTLLQAPIRSGRWLTALSTSRLLPAAVPAELCIPTTLLQALLPTALPTRWAECTATHSSQVLLPCRPM